MEDRVPPQVWRGQEANLDVFRSSQSFAEMLQEHGVTPDESLLCTPTKVKATWQTDSNNTFTVFSEQEGTFYITTERIMFLSSNDNKNKTNDVAIDAGCIQLHAMGNKDEIYIQVQEQADQVEFTVTPITDTTESSSTCQAMFDALSKLVSLHPIPLDNDDHGMMMMSDDAIIAPPPRQQENASTPQERQAMLERLDNLLVVPPEYQVAQSEEQQEGQFEDADEDDAIL